MAERVDVLADLDAIALAVVENGPHDKPGIPALCSRVHNVRAAVAKLIEADRELDAACAAYDKAHVFSLGDREYVSPEDPAVLRLDAAHKRRAAALARVGGVP